MAATLDDGEWPPEAHFKCFAGESEIEIVG